jgi:flagellar export protein FliJ
MSFRLERLLQIRRRAEGEAEQGVARATAARARAEEEQRRLAATFQAARERLAAARGAASGMSTAGEALAAERFWRRVADEATEAHRRSLTHRDGPLAAALAVEESARQAHLVARREREALEKVAERQQARQRRVAHRRAEDAADDLALASRQPKST